MKSYTVALLMLIGSVVMGKDAFALAGAVTPESAHPETGMIRYYTVSESGEILDKHGPETGGSPDEWYLCSGALIGEKTVLTAAHCMWQDEYPQLSLSLYYVYSTDGGNTFSEIPVSSWSIMDFTYYGETFLTYRAFFDLAILTLESPLDDVELPLLSDGKLWSQEDLGAVGEAVGYGQNTSNQPTTAFVKRSGPAEITVLKNSTQPKVDTPNGEWGQQFEWAYKPYASTSDSDRSSICAGDSGGPVFFTAEGETYLLGVMTFNISFRCDVWGDTYAVDVGAQAQWIKETAQDPTIQFATTPPLDMLTQVTPARKPSGLNH